MPVLEAYNADGFKLVRRTLNTDQHLACVRFVSLRSLSLLKQLPQRLVTRLRGVVLKNFDLEPN